jgi:hypothetical protein
VIGFPSCIRRAIGYDRRFLVFGKLCYIKIDLVKR